MAKGKNYTSSSSQVSRDMRKKNTILSITSKKKSIKPLKKGWMFTLYIAGQTPHCMLTFTQLKHFCEKYLFNQYEINIIDLLQNPARALSDNIIAIPTVVKVMPEPSTSIVGDFSNDELMLKRLGLALNITLEPNVKKGISDSFS